MFEKELDFNGDGEMDAGEIGLAVEVLSSRDESDSDDDDSDYELDLAELDRDELEFMDEDERREAIEDTGLDPADYDFD